MGSHAPWCSWILVAVCFVNESGCTACGRGAYSKSDNPSYPRESQKGTAGDLAVLSQLEVQITFRDQEVTAVRRLVEKYNMQMVFREPPVDGMESTITISLPKLPLNYALAVVLWQFGLTYSVEDGIIVVYQHGYP